MSISSVSSSSTTAAMATLAKPEQPKPEAAEATATNSGRDIRKDGDRDDRVAAASAPVKAPVTVNSNGQKIGSVINTTA